MEKCNYVSNLSYLHSALSLCEHPNWAADVSYRRALVQAVMTLGNASAMMHGSHTKLGDIYDADMKSIVAYTAYQSFISKLNVSDPIVLGLSQQPMLDS